MVEQCLIRRKTPHSIVAVEYEELHKNRIYGMTCDCVARHSINSGVTKAFALDMSLLQADRAEIASP